MSNWDLLSEILKDNGLAELLRKILFKLENKFNPCGNAIKVILDETIEWRKDNPHMGKEIVT